MKIIEHGKYYANNNIVTCGMCNCKFEFSENDKGTELISISDSIKTTLPYKYKYSTYVKCPECKTKIYKEFI